MTVIKPSVWDTIELPPIPKPAMDLVGTVVFWQDPADYDPENPDKPLPVSKALCNGVRWVRDRDGHYHPETGLLQYFMDRGDGTMRWTEPSFPMPQPAQG